MSLQASIDVLNSTIIALQATIKTQGETITSRGNEVDAFYIMWAACLVFLMQAGFAMLEAGSVRVKNVRNVLLKNTLDACVGALVWYLWGYGLAGNGNSFIGTEPGNFALSGLDDTTADYAEGGKDWIAFFFSYTFAAAASTIVSGAVAERCQLSAYLVYTIFITGFVYPVIVHWVWNGTGFMSAFNADHIIGGVIDFAGSGVVHMTGGVAGFMGALILGPRLGRWENPEEFDGHSTPLQILGTFLLWFGWYGFNGGSTLVLHTYGRDMARVAVTTTLSAASAGAFGLLIKRFLPKVLGGTGIYDAGHTCNSILGGLVGITAGCVVISAAGSIAVGMCSAIVYHAASCMMRKLKIDDPLDAFAVHGACGAWGCIAVGLFAVKSYSYAPNADSPQYGTGVDGGAFTGQSDGRLLGASVVAVLIEMLWTATLSGLCFGTLNAMGMLRVSKEHEQAGLDDSKHGGQAYKTQGKTAVKGPATV